MMLLSAMAASAAPPTISLNLEGMAGAYKLAQPLYRPHDQALKQPDGAKVKSRQDWTEKCPAGATTSTKTCPFPVARAYDTLLR